MALHSFDDWSAREGGCLCGSIRYRIAARPLTLTACHCTDCQTTSGSAFGMSLLLLERDFEMVAGRAHRFTKTFGDDGRSKHALGCRACLTRVWTEFSAFPQVMNVKPGTLDDTRGLDPVAHTWLRSAQPWVSIPDGAMRFDGQPVDYAPLVAAFAARFERAGS
jgi:hypothetical protein